MRDAPRRSPCVDGDFFAATLLKSLYKTSKQKRAQKKQAGKCIFARTNAGSSAAQALTRRHLSARRRQQGLVWRLQLAARASEGICTQYEANARKRTALCSLSYAHHRRKRNFRPLSKGAHAHVITKKVFSSIVSRIH